MKKLIATLAVLLMCFSVSAITAFADSYKVTANSGLNVRTSQSASSKRVGGLKKNTVVDVISTSNGWHKINYNGKTAYICAKYTTKVTSTDKGNNTNNNNTDKTENKAENKNTLKITRSCNVRSAAGQYNKYLGRANYGNTYKVLGSGKAPNGRLWYKIQYTSSKTGWVCSSFVKVTNSNTITNSNSNTASVPMPTKLKSIGKFTLTAYCKENYPHICNNGNANETSTGAKPIVGRTIAVDPRLIPYGTIVVINGHAYVAEDTGGDIKQRRIDILFETHQEALDFGKQRDVEVFIGV